MKKKILTRANALIVMLLSALGFGACEVMDKYGVPDGPEVLYGPVPEYGVPTSEQVQEEVPSASIVEETE
ncbi:MAG: hypothetical protein II825_05745 [Paludibacteraceae bacterium]|nr:hypothetical protein [Paludibacteraceae bacterium]